MLPSVIDWRITSSCTMDCPFCYGPKNIPSMSLKEAIEVVDKVYKMGVETICITGGEPLLYPHILDVMREINKKGMGIFLSTEGDFFMEHIDKISDFITKLSLPLDGYTSDVHVNNGRTEENYNNVIKILSHYNNNSRNFQIKIATLLTSANISEQDNLIGLYNLLSQYDIDLWKIYELIPAGQAIKNFDKLKYTESQFASAVKNLNQRITNHPNFQIVLSRRKDRDLGYFIIQPNGDVVIPNDTGTVVDTILGNMLNDGVDLIMSDWQKKVNYKNYMINVRYSTKKFMMEESDRKILFELDNDPRQSQYALSNATGCSVDEIDKRLHYLFDQGIINNVIPIINLDKLGFMVYLVNLSLGAVDRDSYRTILNELVNNPNVAWVVRCTGRWSAMIAIFAQNAYQFAQIMMDITKLCGDKLVSYDTHIVYEKYVLGQRYLLIKDKRTDFVFDRSRISLDGDKAKSLTDDEYLILVKIRESREASVDYIVSKTEYSTSKVEKIIDGLQKADILKKFQPVYNVALMGYKWYEVFVRFKNLTENQRRQFVNYIHAIPQVVHINCTIGTWDINFEIHAEDKDEFSIIYNDVKEKFKDIIWKEEFVEILEEKKFSFLVDVVLQEWLENN